MSESITTADSQQMLTDLYDSLNSAIDIFLDADLKKHLIAAQHRVFDMLEEEDE